MGRFVGGAALVLALVAILAVAAVSLRRAPDTAALSLCRGAYQRARTARDSAAVDLQRPVTSRGQATVAVDCRTFRLAGRLGTH